MNLIRLLALLVMFVRPGVGEPADPPADDPQDPPADDGLDADPGEDDPPAEDPPADDHEKTKSELAAEKVARANVERELTELRLRGQPQAQPSEEERIRGEEDKRLKDEKTGDLEKWQIAANRELRAGRNAAQFALAQAHDVSDKTSFASIAMSDPVAKKYEARVEQELAQARAKGGNASRESIYTYLLGKDMREGKFKKKAAPSSSSSSAERGQQTGVQRGKLPGARSDVRAGSAMTNKQKLEKKLENVQI